MNSEPTKIISRLAHETFLSKGLSMEKLKDFANKVPTIFPWDAEYNNARINFNHRYNVFPLMIVLAESDQDIIQALRFLEKYKIDIVIRSRRHCAENFSLTTGCGLTTLSKTIFLKDGIIDQGKRQSIKVDEKNRTMIVRSGAQIGPAINKLWKKYKLFLPTGTCFGVSLVGLCLGGGIGYSQRKYGLTCDSLLEAKIILANGKKVRTSANENSSLFWALRGAGNGNFGIVTSLKFKLYPVQNVTIFQLDYPFKLLKKVWRTFQKFAYKTPREITMEINIKYNKLAVIGQSFANEDETRKILSFLLELNPNQQKIKSVPYIEAARFFDDGISLPFYKNKNSFVNTTKWPSKAISTISKFFSSKLLEKAPERGKTSCSERYTNLKMSCGGKTPQTLNVTLQFTTMGGAISDISPRETAYFARDQKYWLLINASWTEQCEEAINIAFVTELYNRLLTLTMERKVRSTLVYVNQPDVDIDNYLEAYYGENVPRLIEIKSEVDPKNIFHFQQSIPVKSGTVINHFTSSLL